MINLGNEETVELLIQKNANVNASDDVGVTALISASANRNCY